MNREISFARVRTSFAFVLLCTSFFSQSLFADELPRLDVAITKLNEAQIRDSNPVFDFDSDGCYPGTPFHRGNELSPNPGLAATGTVWGACRDANWGLFANTLHRQLCNERDEVQGRVTRCAHFYELYFEKDQAVGGSFLGGHRHDVETVIVWTGRIHSPGGGVSEFVSHVSASAHGAYSTRHISNTIRTGNHAHIVYHKDGVGTHAFRFATQQDKDNVEFQGNWGVFYAPDIVSHYRAYKTWNNDEWDRYWQNRQYRQRMQDTSFGSASFKTRNDSEILTQANKAIPQGDSFWANFTFTWNDVWTTRDRELQANYPGIYSSLPAE